MDAVFRVEREKQNFLFYKEYQNDRSVFGFHSQVELYIVDEGEMDITVNSYRKILKANQMCVVSSFDAHCYSTPKNSKSRVLIIPTYLCNEFMDNLKNQKISSPFICNESVVKEIKSYIVKLNDCKDNEIKKHGFIYVILGTVLENINLEPSSESLDSKLSTKLLTYVNNNFREDINLKTIASKFGYNQSYISRYFKSCFNVGFNQYLTTLRLKNALMLMHENEFKLTYCALESGFNSIRTFYRAFYNEFGCTPKEYIKKYL